MAKVSSSASLDESVRITVVSPDAATGERGVSVVSVTPVQVVGPLLMLTVNGVPVSKALPRPVTLT